MSTTNFYLKITLVLIAAAMLSACGASKGSADNYDQSSRLNTTTITNNDTLSRPLAYCNQSSNSQIGINTSTYQDGETISLTRINLKITKIPSYFAQGQNYIEFQKFMINAANSKMWGSSRLYFKIYSIADGTPLLAGESVLYWPALQAAAQKVGASTPAQFFNKVRIVIELEDPNGEYDVIVAKYFDQDDTLVSQLESLIPVFDADPTKYAIEKDASQNDVARATALQNLHPFKSYVNQGWTAQTYATKAYEFCKPVYTVQ
ncbi:MAG: hypothetical protein JNL11_01605 [Bdellovibrionaceae bacterium]|nr:hypothetical protein [Pseudobdellovibrionaceae bacterium]